MDENGKRKLAWKEVGKVNGGKVENYIRIKSRTGRKAVNENDVRMS